MDLLKILSKQLNFGFELKEVEDGKWGSINKVSELYQLPTDRKYLTFCEQTPEFRLKKNIRHDLAHFCH